MRAVAPRHVKEEKQRGACVNEAQVACLKIGPLKAQRRSQTGQSCGHGSFQADHDCARLHEAAGASPALRITGAANQSASGFEVAQVFSLPTGAVTGR